MDSLLVEAEDETSIGYQKVMKHLTQFAHSILTDSGEILRFPEEYHLQTLVAVNATETAASSHYDEL